MQKSLVINQWSVLVVTFLGRPVTRGLKSFIKLKIFVRSVAKTCDKSERGSDCDGTSWTSPLVVFQHRKGVAEHVDGSGSGHLITLKHRYDCELRLTMKTARSCDSVLHATQWLHTHTVDRSRDVYSHDSWL